uniref:AAA+ ATPase domain-containing protein n=1 Tax=Plectus sambesii TaxID=2011161 RepID=A0A914V1T0_9BILA
MVTSRRTQFEFAARPPPWKQSNDDGSSFRAALLSGPPGIGKTTSAQLVCRELGLLAIEMNASDTRNKKNLDATVGELTGNTQIEEYFGKAKKAPQNQVSHVLIMDEVDGMSGNQDRAGIQELIAMIKSSKIPILCICNDRQAQKIRSLA